MGLVRLDKIGADTHILNVKATSAMVNGNIAKVGTYSEFDVYSVSAPTAITEDFVFIAEQFISKHPLDREENFAIKVGDIVRGYQLRKGDVVTLTKDLITGVPVKDQFIIPQAGHGLKFSATLGGTESLAFVVEDITEKLGGFDACVIRVIKA